jgi:hypothetical protein
MKKKIYLHIGLHKTGTTSIQVFFTRKKDVLEARGVLYPLTGRPQRFKFGQHQLPWSVTTRENYLPDPEWKRGLSENDVNVLWTSLANEIETSAAPSVVISSEEFDTLDSEEIKSIGRRLSSYDITPVIFIRNHADFLESSYRTAVMHSGYTNSLEHLANNSRSRLDYFNLIQDWRSISLDGRVIVLNYDDANIRSNSIIAFTAACFPVCSELWEMAQDESRLNESFPPYVIEIVRYLRSKEVDAEKIQQWVSHAVSCNKANVLTSSTCMSYKLREVMLSKYSDEMKLFLSDLELSEIGRQGLEFIGNNTGAENGVTSVMNEIDALLFMSSEKIRNLNQ